MAKTEIDVESVIYISPRDSVQLILTDGTSIEIPRGHIEELAGLSLVELRALEVGGAGSTINQRERDIDIYVPGLLAELFAPAAQPGRPGGSQKSEAKANR